MLGSALGLCFQALLEHRIGDLPAAEADFRQAIEITPSARWAAKTYALAFLIDICWTAASRDAAAVLSREPDAGHRTAGASVPDAPAESWTTADRARRGDSGISDMHAAAEGFAAGSFGACLWPWWSYHALSSPECLPASGPKARSARRRPGPGLRCAARVGISLRTSESWRAARPCIASLREAVEVSIARRGARAGPCADRPRGRSPAGGSPCGGTGASTRRAGRRASLCSGGLGGAGPQRDGVGRGSAAARRGAWAGSLTASELRVARKAAEGMTNREIAQDLFVSLRTVETHLDARLPQALDRLARRTRAASRA